MPRQIRIVMVLLVVLSGILPLVFLSAPELILLQPSSGAFANVPYRISPFFLQFAAVAAGFVIKPIYMLLAGVLIIILWRVHQSAPEIELLKWGLIFFLVGEIFCSINYIFFHELSDTAEYLHSLGMVLGVALFFLALFEGLDRRIIHYSGETTRCTALALCGRCYKYQASPCGLRRLFLFAILLMALMVAIPLTAAPIEVSYTTTIFGTIYNYTHALIQQLYELRYAPIVAGLFFFLSFLVLLAKGMNSVTTSKTLLALGLGYLTFGLMRIFLLHTFSTEMVWFIFWEEATELFLMLAIAISLFVFRDGLHLRVTV